MEDIHEDTIEREEKINTMEKKKQKKKRAPTAWNIHSMKVYKDMKAKDPSVKFSAALKAAGKTFKKK